MTKQAVFKTVGIYGKYNDASVQDALSALSNHLESKGVHVLIGDTTAREIATKLDNLSVDKDTLEQLDLAIVIGGDGTMLHVARLMAPHDVSIVGVNMGTLGFLTDIRVTDMIAEIDEILDGNYDTEERMLLNITVEKCANGDCTEVVHSEVAFNDVVIGRDTHAKLLDWRCYVNGELLTSARSDGVIVATPTGSTAYALSAGGPIVQPGVSAISIVPISPHTLSNRPIVLPEDCVIEFRLDSSNMSASHVSADGLISFQPEGCESIFVRRSENNVTMIKPKSHNYFSMLRSKLGWGGGDNDGSSRPDDDCCSDEGGNN